MRKASPSVTASGSGESRRDYDCQSLTLLREGESFGMRKLITIALALGIFVSLSGAHWPVEGTPSPQLLSSILNKMELAHRNLKSLRTTIIQQKTNVQIGITDTDYGTLIYKPDAKGKGRLRIDYTRPDVRIVSIVGDKFTFYQPRINQVIKTTLAQAAKGRVSGFSQLIGLDGSLKAQAGNYHIEFVKEEMVNGEKTTQLHLVPKNGGAIVSIDLWVSHSTWLPVKHKFVEQNGDYTIVQFTNLELNAKIADGAFNVAVPKGTVVVDKI